MKQLLFLVFIMGRLLALCNGNPTQPNMPETGVWISDDNWWGFKLGYEWDKIFDKRIRVKEQCSSIRERYDTFAMLKNQGVLAFNISDRFEFYGKLGAMKIELAQRPIDTIRIQYFADSQLLWSFGGSIIPVYWKEMVIKIDVSYSSSFMRISEILDNGMPRKTSDACFKYNEWQMGIGFSKEIGIFSPYIGLAYASMHSSLDNVSDNSNFIFHVANKSFENHQPFILCFGFGLTKGKHVSVNLESRVVGEKAISLLGSFRF